jgi:hypothetical protein
VGHETEPSTDEGIMKKFLTIGILTVAAATISTQEAPAWVNWKVGVGANIGWQAGGNNFLWGLFRNGQPPAPDFCGGGGYGGQMGPGCGQFPHASNQPNAHEQSVNANADAAAAAYSASGRTQSFSQPPWYGQTVNYQRPYYPSYYTYPYYNYGHSYYGYGR